ncbi:MAG TPA: sortase [Candidatus Dormibacteraeota bacterium]
MANLVRRWRAPLVGGVAIWLLSFPLLTWHPVAAIHPVYAGGVAIASADAADHRLVRQLERERVAAAQAAAEAAAQAAAEALAQAAKAAAAAAAQAALAVQAAPPPNRPAPAPLAVRANTIVIPRLGLVQPVGWYGDCLGRAAVPRWGSWRWSCAGSNNIYVMAHNPGTFTPILGLRAGDIVQYGDPSGRVHTYRVSYTTIVSNTQMWPLGATSASSLTLQTCWTWDGSRDFIVRALEI